MKELWEVPAGRVAAGRGDLHDGVSADHEGIRRRVDLRLERQRRVARLRDRPRLCRPADSIRSTCCSTSSSIRLSAKLLEGGKMIRYGAKSMPYGGWWAMPPVAGNGWMILGDSAGFLNSQRLKGIHLAIKSGMLAAETAFDALIAGDSSATMLGEFQKRVRIELDQGRALQGAQLASGIRARHVCGMLHTGLQMITGGRGLRNRYPREGRLRAHAEAVGLPADGGAEAQLCLALPRATAS